MKTRPPVIRLMRHLTALAVAVGALSTFSYASGAHLAWRYINPGFGDWWNRHEFWLMEGAASAFGILVGVRIGVRLIGDSALKVRAAVVSLALAAAALYWLTPMLAATARLGWTAPAAAIGLRTGAVVGYTMGQFLDKLLIAGVYSLKTAGFAILAGLALIALVLGVMIAAGRFPEAGDRSASSF
ncbi:MAG: hypothetical protein WA005_07565 [Candidatus Binataceae bacterium]